MEYDKIRNKVNKFYKGGKIQKFNDGGPIPYTEEQKQQLRNLGVSESDIEFAATGEISFNDMLISAQANANKDPNEVEQTIKLKEGVDFGSSAADKKNANQQSKSGIINNGPAQLRGGTDVSAIAGNITDVAQNFNQLKENGQLGGAIGGIAAQVGVGAMKAIDSAAMGDKNFGAQSAAIDSAVHGVSGALMSSGNPYAMAAAAAIEGANFLTKAGGQTVQGFDVNIENSGFGTLGHMESSSSRDFGAMIGLGGLNAGKMQAKLARRNEQARMALQAAEISEDVKFEQEARMNSIDNVLRNNQIALAGGVDTNLLGA